MKNLYKILQRLILRKFLTSLQSTHQVALVTILENKINVVGSFFDVDQPDDVVILATPKHLNLIIQQFGKLAWVIQQLPLILSRRMLFIATSWPSTLLYPRYTSPNCPEPIFDSSTYTSTDLGIAQPNFYKNTIKLLIYRYPQRQTVNIAEVSHKYHQHHAQCCYWRACLSSGLCLSK